jgi:hypothetical protein
MVKPGKHLSISKCFPILFCFLVNTEQDSDTLSTGIKPPLQYPHVTGNGGIIYIRLES